MEGRKWPLSIKYCILDIFKERAILFYISVIDTKTSLAPITVMVLHESNDTIERLLSIKHDTSDVFKKQ